MPYEPFQQDGAWWFGVTKHVAPLPQGLPASRVPLYKTGGCASLSCLGHSTAAEARLHMKRWLFSRMILCTFQELGPCAAPHRLADFQAWLWRSRAGRALQREGLLPAVTDLGYTCQVLSTLSVRLCEEHRTMGWLERLMPEPEEVLR